MTKKILFVLTSHDQLGNSGQQTGWYAEEVAEPATVLYRNGYEIVYASPKGGKAPLDKGSIEAAKNNPNTVAFLANKDYQHKVDNTHKVSEFIGRESEFDAIIYPGGHGPMFDLEHDESALKLTAAAYEAGKVVGAICHGPIALSDVVLKDGTYMIKGKNVTSFSDDEERQVQKDHLMPVLLETKLKQRGAHYHKAAQPWGEKIVTDGLIVTGQNPGSAPAFGEAILAAIQATAH